MANKNKKYKRSIEDAGRISDEEYYNIIEEEVANQQRNQKKNGGVNYKVKKGDSLSKIARQYTGNALRYNELAKLNGIENPDKIEVGQNIVIPKQFLDTIKDTNLPEVVVTGNKNNTRINKLKINAPNIIHEEKPSTLRVKKQNFNNSSQSTKAKTFIDDIIQNATNLYQQGTNYIVRQYEKNVGDKDSASTLKIPSKTKLNKAYNIIPKSYTGDTIKVDKNKYIIPESINLNEVKLGTRNRGSREQLNTEGAIITNFDPYMPYDKIDKKNNTTTYMGIDKNGKFKVGTIDKFNFGDLLTKTYANDVESFVKDNKGNQLFKPASGNNRSRNVPIINVIENGKIKQGSLNILSNKGSKNSNTYGTITGGRVILEAGNERRLVSGSLNDIEKQFNDIKKRHGAKTVRMYTLDNGTYNRALRTKNRIISASDLQAYDNLNSSGGSFMYLLNNKNINTDASTNKIDYEKIINILSKSKRKY